MTDEKTLNLYDSIISFLVTDISQKTGGKDIGLANFNPKSNEHLTVFYGALYTASLVGKKVITNLSKREQMMLTRKHKGMKHLFERVGEDTLPLDVPNEVGQIYMNVPGTDALNDLGCVYEEYYAPENQKKGK